MKNITDLIDEKEIIDDEVVKMKLRLIEINRETIELLLNHGALDCFNINWNRVKSNFGPTLKQKDYNY